MPIDSRNKRASVLGFVGPSRVVFPDPDGSLGNAADRQQIAYSYAGIDTTVVVAATTKVLYAVREDAANKYAVRE